MVNDFLISLRSFDLTCLTVIVGVLIATFIMRVRGINPGGILGASFLLLAASDSIAWALVLLAVAPLVSWLYARYLSHIYAGREPIFIMAGMSVGLTIVLGLVLQHFHLVRPNEFSFPLGIIVPAIVGSAIRKQGLTMTYRYLGLSMLLTLEAVIMIRTTGLWLGYDFNALQHLMGQRQMLELQWRSLFAVTSVAIGYLMYKHFRIKAAGFVVLPLLATLVVVSPLNFLLLMATAAIVYSLTALLQRYSLIIGISRYTLVCIMSVTAVWTVTYVLLHHTTRFSPFLGTGLFAALAVSVLVNEHTLYGIRRTMPVFAVSLAAMACLEVGGSALVALTSQQPHSLHYYVIRQSTDPTRH